MAIDEKVDKTLAELGVSDSSAVHSLFAEYAQALEAEKLTLFNTKVSSQGERDKLCRSLRDRWLARKSGLIARIDEHQLKTAPKDYKPVVGAQFNSLRKKAADLEFQELVRSFPPQLGAAGPSVTTEAGSDLTLPGYGRPLGSIHPITRVQREIEDIFLSLGFSIETGPEVETVYYNFDALNIPESHPARDDWDTIYVDAGTVLRTHTSPVQIRAMEKYGAPLYIIVPGKCYRHDNPDSSHSPMFHQIEGLAVDKDVTFADLKGTLDLFAKKFFGERIRTNFFPSFFPFTEPSGDLAISCVICGGQGCRTCKESGWVEVMGCGMVHPDVLERVGLDPNRYSGWAFGLGLDRFAMMKYRINDIQLFFQSDLRFLEQF